MKPTDPLLANHHWRTVIRKHWQQKRLPCARCGGPIDYDGPRFLFVRGKRKLNPRSLVVGHKTSRHQARRNGWTDAQINDLSNTQPECARCSASSGAKYGNRLRGRSRSAAVVTTSTALRW